jgi:hypothetical protein
LDSHGASCDGVHIGAIHETVGVEVVRQYRRGLFDASGQSQSVENVDATIAVDVYAIDHDRRPGRFDRPGRPDHKTEHGSGGQWRPPQHPNDGLAVTEMVARAGKHCGISVGRHIHGSAESVQISDQIFGQS